MWNEPDVTTSPWLIQPAPMERQSTCIRWPLIKKVLFCSFVYSFSVSGRLRLCLYYYFLLNLPINSLVSDYSYYFIYEFTYSLIPCSYKCFYCVQGFVLLLFDCFISVLITGHTLCVCEYSRFLGIKKMYFEPCTMFYRCSWWDCFITSKTNRCNFIFRIIFVKYKHCCLTCSSRCFFTTTEVHFFKVGPFRSC